LLQRTFAKLLFGTKESATGQVVSFTHVGQPVWHERNYEQFSREGYVRNAIAFRCITLIAQSAASIDIDLYNKKTKKEIEEHALLSLLNRPSPTKTGSELIESLITFLKISGNAYIEGVSARRSGAAPTELYSLRPDRMRVIAGPKGLPSGYEYEANGQKHVWEVDQVNGYSPIKHLKLFHPIDDWYGLSNMEAGAFSIDQHNEASAHNMAVLQNSAVPSGALVLKPVTSEGQVKHAPQNIIDAAEARLQQMYTGSKNAGRPMVLGGNVDWIKIGQSLEELEMTESKLDSARDICNTFGVPHVLIVPGQSTYNNVAEAKLALYEETVLPLLDWILDHLNSWLTPQFGDSLALKVDTDSIDALSPRREEKRKTYIDLFDKKIVTRNEVREALGYEAIEGRPDFDPQSHEVGVIKDLMNAGKLSKETGWTQLSRWGVLPADLIAKDEQEKLDGETETSDGLLGLEDDLPLPTPLPKPPVAP